MGDYDWLAPLISGVAKGAVDVGTGLAANDQMQGTYAEMLRRLAEREADYDALGTAGYKPVTAEQVGPSALEGIQGDPAARQAQLEAMAALDELAKNGGLSLADLKALNDMQRGLNQNDASRRKGLANEFAARGQLGSGAQLAMAMQGQQDAAQNANQQSESVAAQAQRRALEAILQRGSMGRSMGNDDYARKADAARARDAIEARNAAARMQAQGANNAIAGQNFTDQLAKARGKTDLTNASNQAVFGKGAQQARTTGAMGGYTNKLIDTGATAFDAWNKDSPDYGGASHAATHEDDEEP